MSGDDWEKRKFPRAVASGLEEWVDIERTLTAYEREAREQLEKIAGPEVAGWFIDTYAEREHNPRGPAVKRPPPPAGFEQWWCQHEGKTTVLAATYARYLNAHVRIRRLVSEGNYEKALTLAVGWMINPDDIRDAEAIRVGRSKSGQRRAKAITKLGIELAHGLLQRGKKLTCKALFEEYRPYRLDVPEEVWVGDRLALVWFEEGSLFEQGRLPPGPPKPVGFETFKKKPYYFPAIRRAVGH